MSKKARQMPDGNHSFVELQQLWRQGVFTLEECITQLLHAMVRFEERRLRLDMMLLPYQVDPEELSTWQSYEALLAETKGKNLMEAMQKDKSAAYQAIDFALEQYAMLEVQFIQMEVECAEMIRLLNQDSSEFN